MKTSFKYLPVLVLAILTLTLPLAKVNSTEGEEEQPDGEEVHAAREAYRRQFLEDENGEIPPNAWQDAYEQKQAMQFLPEAWDEFQDPYGLASLEPNVLTPWVLIGPGNIAGRIRSIIIHPTNPAIMWVGAVSGGIWKTTNGGTSWTTNTDFLPNLAVNCMVMDPVNPNILYAGTGEGFYTNNHIRGAGIFKTTDGGENWILLESTREDPAFFWINRLAISPTNPQLLLAATRSGKILRSTNGGTSWLTQLQSSAMVDVRFRPNNGTNAPTVAEIVTCVAASFIGQVYYSTDDGLTWDLTTGLPAPDNHRRVELAYSRSDPSIIYASAAADGTLYQLYPTTGGGYHFVAKGSPPGGTGVSFFNNSLWVDPTNPDIVMVGAGAGESLWRTTQGGAPGSWTSSRGGHEDHHVIVEHPGYNGTSNQTLFEGNDGGIYKTTNALGATQIWASLNNNLAITQFYGGAGNIATGTIIGGNQDNGTVRFRPSDGPANWRTLFTGDGGACAADQTDPNYFYGEYINLQIFRSTNGGAKASYIWRGPDGHPEEGIPAECNNNQNPCADFIAPFILDPNNPNTLLAGGKSLWRSRNATAEQPSWSEIRPPTPANCTTACSYISAIAVAPGDSNIIWVGYANGSVYQTENGNAANPTWNLASNGLPARHCTRIAIGQAPQTNDPEVGGRKVYVTFKAFKSDNVWRTQNNGGVWTPIHNNLPYLPVYSVVISPTNPDKVYLGTELGVFATNNGTAQTPTWSPSGASHPNAVVWELFWMGSKLVSATHGRGMFTLGQ